MPTAYQALTSLVLSCLVVGVVFREAIAGHFVSTLGIDQGALNRTYDHQLNLLSQIQFAQLAVVALFWAALGLIAYFIYGLVARAFASAFTTASIQFSYLNQGRSNFSRPLRLLGWAASLCVLIALTIKWLLPVWLGLFHSFIMSQNLLAVRPIVQGAGAILGLAINIYFIWMSLDAVVTG